MRILRTPDSCFEQLDDYQYQPHYTEIDVDGAAMRIHHIDEGPKDAPIVLLIHGQPTWSYLYRKMIQPLVNAHLRVVAPDLPGYGRSDKPAALEDYSYQNQVDWMTQWLVANDFNNIHFFGQDWGGLIGLRMVVEQPERYSGIVISNTGLPYNPDTPQVVIDKVMEFRKTAPTPSLPQMGKAIAGMRNDDPALAFAHWQKFCWETENLPIGLLMTSTVESRSPVALALHMLFSKLGLDKISPFTTELSRAYSAPFPSPEYKMGPRAMPSQVPSIPDASLKAQAKAWQFFEKWDKPFLCVFADDDPVTKGGESAFIAKVPGAQGQPHRSIGAAGHFCQERKPDELAQAIIDQVQVVS